MFPGAITSDTDLVPELSAREITDQPGQPGQSDDDALEHALMRVLPTLSGAFSFVLCDQKRIIGVRDPHGFRPLCLGRLDGGWVLASEKPALDVLVAPPVPHL